MQGAHEPWHCPHRVCPPRAHGAFRMVTSLFSRRGSSPLHKTPFRQAESLAEKSSPLSSRLMFHRRRGAIICNAPTTPGERAMNQ